MVTVKKRHDLCIRQFLDDFHLLSAHFFAVVAG